MILKFDHHKYCPARQARATTCSLPTREGMHKFITIAGSDRKSLSIPGGDFLDISSMASAPSWKATADAAIVSRSRSSLMNFQRPLPLQRRASSKTSCFALDCSLDSARYWNASFAVRLLLLLLPDILIFLIEFWGFWIRYPVSVLCRRLEPPSFEQWKKRKFCLSEEQTWSKLLCLPPFLWPSFVSWSALLWTNRMTILVMRMFDDWIGAAAAVLLFVLPSDHLLRQAFLPYDEWNTIGSTRTQNQYG